MWASRRTSNPSAASGGTVSTVSWAEVGGVQKVKSETRREEREIGYYCDLRGGWENGALGPELVSSSLRLSVGVYVGMFVCVWFKVSSMTPGHFSPSGLVFSSASPAVPGSPPRSPHTPAHIQGLLGDDPTTTSCCKDPPCSLLTLPRSASRVTPGAPASTLSISLLVCLPPHRARAP